jgi:choline monooxygenase
MSVVEGAAVERSLRCRYHGRRFSLDGTFHSMPEFDGVEDFPRPCDDLPKVPFGRWGKLLFGSVRPAAPIEAVIEPMRERMAWLPLTEFCYEPSRAREYMVHANWALYVDNYLEGFHIPYIHASLNSTLDYENYSTHQYAWSNLQFAVAKDGEEVFDLPEGSPDFGARIGAYYYWVFPNTMFNFYPWGSSINVVRPLGPELTKISFLPYVWRAEKLNRGAGSALDRVERVDVAVVEAVQRGVRSRFYDRGRFSVRREANVHQFHRLIAQAMSRPES